MDKQTYQILEHYLGGIVKVQEARAQGIPEEDLQNLEDIIADPKLIGTVHYLLKNWGLNLKTIGVNTLNKKLHIKTDMWPDILDSLIEKSTQRNVKVYYNSLPGKWNSTLVVKYKDVTKALDLMDGYNNIVVEGYEEKLN